MEIKIKNGLDIPLAGNPEKQKGALKKPKSIALSLDPFEEIKFKLMVKQGDQVKIGQPLLENKLIPGQFFVSPAAGAIQEIRRGERRRLENLVILLDAQEEDFSHPQFQKNWQKEETIAWLMETGLFPHIRMRPFGLIAHPGSLPHAIFIKGIESEPFIPSVEMQLEGNESFFLAGLEVLNKICDQVHLISSETNFLKFFNEIKNVTLHIAKGPHPIGNPSVHIHYINPIRNASQIVWSIDVIGLIAIGKMALVGKYYIDRIISIAGNGVLEEKRGFYKGRMGYPIQEMIEGKIPNQLLRLISGSILTGKKVSQDDFLGFYHTCLSIIPENLHQQLFHFMRPGFNKYSATRTYLSGHLSPPDEGFSFTTNQHGEERAFIDGSIYDKVMPMRIPTMQLIKAILAEDYELAEKLGLLEVVPEDFALSTFICPSKIEMMEIVKKALQRYSKEMGY